MAAASYPDSLSSDSSITGFNKARSTPTLTPRSELKSELEVIQERVEVIRSHSVEELADQLELNLRNPEAITPCRVKQKKGQILPSKDGKTVFKVIPKKLSHRSSMPLIMREVKAFNHLMEKECPGTIKLVRVFESKDVTVLQIENGGKDLFTRAFEETRDYLTIDKIRSIAEQCFTILAKFHETGLVHNDIKPENFVMDDQGVIRLIDFGLTFHRESEKEPVLREFTYMPPETIARGAKKDQKVDSFSMGILLLALFNKTHVLGPTKIGNHIYRQLKTYEEVFEDQIPDTILETLAIKRSHYQYATPNKGINPISLLLNYTISKRNAVLESSLTIKSPIIDLMLKLVRLDPEARPSCAEALSHPFFQENQA